MIREREYLQRLIDYHADLERVYNKHKGSLSLPAIQELVARIASRIQEVTERKGEQTMLPPCPKCHKETAFDFWSSTTDRVYFWCQLCNYYMSFGERNKPKEGN